MADREWTRELPAGYRAAEALRYLGRDGDSRCERVAGTSIVKAVRLAGQPALLSVEVGRRSAHCRVATARPAAAVSAPVAAAARTAVDRMLGLTLDPAPFERRMLKDPRLARLVASRRGLRIPLSAEPFEGLVWAIVGQQVHLTFAATLRRRVVELCGEPLASLGIPGADGLFAPPTPAAVAELDPEALTARQFSRRKAEYLIGAAQAIARGELALDHLAAEPAAAVEARLLALRGIGPWTAHYVMLRALGFADCVPVGDSGLAAGLARLYGLDHRPGGDETRRLMAPFAPYRSLATAHIWAALGETL